MQNQKVIFRMLTVTLFLTFNVEIGSDFTVRYSNIGRLPSPKQIGIYN